MSNISKICPLVLFAASLIMMFSIAGVIAQEGLLDGKEYVGQYREKHIRAVKDDEVRFMQGRFHSIGYAQKGFNAAVYSATEEGDKIFFEAETLSPKHGNIKWRGIVQGDAIEVNYHWSKKGWLNNTEKDYTFNGTLKK